MLSNRYKIQQPLYFPDDNTGNAGPPLDSPDAILDFLNADDDNEPDETIELDDKKPKKQGKDTTEEKVKKEDSDSDEDDEDEDEEIDELKELEDELEEPDEEQLELVTPVRRKDILKKYPQLFKDFPYLEKAYYREQQYTELLPTIDDAKMAVEKSKTLDKFENELLSGDTKGILEIVKTEDPKAFAKLCDGYMDALAAVDEKSYYHVVGNLAKGIIYKMVQEARAMGESEGAPLQSAAALLNQFLFGTTKYVPPSALSVEEKPENNEKERALEEKEQKFEKQRFESARDNLGTRVENSIRKTIEQYIDPRSVMTDYVKKTAIKESVDTVQNLLGKDTRFKSLLDKLWDNAYKNDYNTESLEKIRSAVLSRAKTLLPAVLKKARNEALKGMGKRVKEDSTDDDTDTTERNVTKLKGKQGQSTSSRNGGQSTKGANNQIPAGMSTRDWLLQD
jgi:hypothetical protein